jgi:hypothetical protein
MFVSILNVMVYEEKNFVRFEDNTCGQSNIAFQVSAVSTHLTFKTCASKCCILYIFSTNISTEYFKHATHSPFFSSKCRLFHNVTFLGLCIIYILNTGCAKI